jgi:hypothetical protein
MLAAARGDTKTIDRLELQYSLSELEKELAELVNFCKTRTDTDIGDWGNVISNPSTYLRIPPSSVPYVPII